MPAIGEYDRIAPLRLVAGEILVRDDAVSPAHLRFDQLRRAACVKSLRSIGGDASQHGSEVGIAPAVARVRYVTIWKEQRGGGGEARKSRTVTGNCAREVGIHDEALLGERDSRRYELRPRARAKALVRLPQSCH